MRINIVPVRRYCPNCGHIVSGYRGENGIAKLSCCLCGTVFVSKLKGRRHDNMDIYAPKGAVFAEFCTDESELLYGIHE
jgi:transcription elongation factor Elf1